MRPWQLLQGLLDAATSVAGKARETLDDIQAAVQSLPAGSPARAELESMLARCAGSKNAFVKAVDDWAARFDAQVIGWYRRKTHAVLMLLSLLLSLGLNLDSVAFMRQLASEPKTLAALVKLADGLEKNEELPALVERTALKNAQGVLDKASTAQAAAAVEVRAAASAAAAASTVATLASAASAPEAAAFKAIKDQELDEAKKKLAAEDQSLQQARAAVQEQRQLVGKEGQRLVEELANTGLRFGWTGEEWAKLKGAGTWEKLLGLLVTALALSLGAPFWFDMLKQVASIRSVGKNLQEQEAKKVADKT